MCPSILLILSFDNLLKLPQSLLLGHMQQQYSVYPLYLLNPQLVLGTGDVIRRVHQVAEERVKCILKKLLLINGRDNLEEHISLLLKKFPFNAIVSQYIEVLP